MGFLAKRSMASAKIVTRKKKNKDGTIPIVLRITKDRRTSYIYLGKNVDQKDWDATNQKVKRSHPSSQRLNNFLLKKLTEAQNAILDFELKQADFTVEDLRQKLSSEKTKDTFFAQAELYFENLAQAENYNRLTAERPAVNHFRRFLEDKDIAFSNITISLLERFKAYLIGKIKVSERTAVNYLIIIRTLYKRAIKNGITDKQHYPFGIDKFHIKKPEGLKIGLNEAEVKRLEAVKLKKGSFEDHSRNLWLYSFYFAGMRVSDVLLSRWSDLKDDRIFYVMGKNKKPGSLKVPEKAQIILNQYEGLKRSDDDLIFPDLKMIEDFKDKVRVQKRIKEVIRRVNLTLKKIAEKADIDKPLTMHIARHTFGNISGDRIPIQMLQKLYRHSSITTTINYQKNFLFKEADDALDSVLDF